MAKVKAERCEADHSPQSSVEVEKIRAVPLLSHVFMAQCLTKHRDTFTFKYIGCYLKMLESIF
jgi:hypothetical protein